jgi:hypothetical protein
MTNPHLLPPPQLAWTCPCQDKGPKPHPGRLPLLALSHGLYRVGPDLSETPEEGAQTVLRELRIDDIGSQTVACGCSHHIPQQRTRASTGD